VAATGDAAPPDGGVAPPPPAHATTGVPLERPSGLRFAAAAEDSLTLAWRALLPVGGAFRLSWAAAAVDSGAAAAGGSKTCPAAAPARAGAQECTVSGLDPGRVYSVTVRSVLGDFEDPRGAGPVVASPAAPPAAARLCFLDRTEVRLGGRGVGGAWRAGQQY
jgi:hypothetical protein